MRRICILLQFRFSSFWSSASRRCFFARVPRFQCIGSTAFGRDLRNRFVHKYVGISARNALKDATQKSYAAVIGQLLERYRFADSQALLTHANSKMEVGDAVLTSAGCALLASAAGYLWLHMTIAAAAMGIVCQHRSVFPAQTSRSKARKSFQHRIA